MIGRLFNTVRALGIKRRQRQAVERTALRVHELAAAGRTPAQIARETGLTREAVRMHLDASLPAKLARRIRQVPPVADGNAAAMQAAHGGGRSSGERQIFDSQQFIGYVADGARRARRLPLNGKPGSREAGT